MLEHTTTRRRMIPWLLLLPVLSAQAAGALEFPGPVLGRASVTRSDSKRLRLRNNVLEAVWTFADGHPRLEHVVNRMTDERIVGSPGGQLVVVLAGGKRIDPSSWQIVGEPSIESIPAQPDAVRRSLRSSGKQVTLKCVCPVTNLRIEWQVVLRDGSNYVRQHVSLRPAAGTCEVEHIQLLELRAPKARTVGTVEGSPVVAGSIFAGCESPIALHTIENGRAMCAVPLYTPATPDRPLRRSAVIGVVPPGQLRRGFLYYVERERPRPYRLCVHYNSWYDIAWKDRKMSEPQCLERIDTFGRELFAKRGAGLDAFVFDDGWDDNQTLWGFHEGFPRGFTRMARAAAKYRSMLGVWLSPWGGYSVAKKERLTYGATQGFETNRRGFSLAGPKYYKRFRDVCLDMIRKQGVGYFKFDGVGGGSDTGGAGHEFGPDIEALLRLLSDLRAAKPDVFLNVTAGTWPSPFWLRHSDAVWRGGRDASHKGPGSMRQRWLTYRDALARQIATQRGPLFPLNSLKSQGLCLGQLGGNYAKLGTDPKDIIDEIRMMFLAGTQQADLFVTPAKMTPALWDALADAIRWSRENRDVLIDVHWIGGDPAQAEVYGYASWSPRKGIVGLRNPLEASAAYELDLRRALQLPPNAPKRYTLQCKWAGDANRSDVTVEVGKPIRIKLAPFEIVVFEATPAKTTERDSQ